MGVMGEGRMSISGRNKAVAWQSDVNNAHGAHSARGRQQENLIHRSFVRPSNFTSAVLLHGFSNTLVVSIIPRRSLSSQLRSSVLSSESEHPSRTPSLPRAG